jgi:signal transduction histidine kinase
MADLEQGLNSTLNVAWNEIKYKADVVKEYAGVPELYCLPSQINQVFLNLLINAAHAIEGKGTIVVRTGYDDKLVWVEIEDNGSGIAPDHLDHIFEPFFTTKPVGKGTGLGLSIVYGIVQEHRGTIDVKSEVGRGTMFRVALPRSA